MTPVQIREFKTILADHTAIHHLRITTKEESIDYVIEKIDFESPPILLMKKMYDHRDEPDKAILLDYNNLQKIEVIGHDKSVLFKWMVETEK